MCTHTWTKPYRLAVPHAQIVCIPSVLNKVPASHPHSLLSLSLSLSVLDFYVSCIFQATHYSIGVSGLLFSLLVSNSLYNLDHKYILPTYHQFVNLSIVLNREIFNVDIITFAYVFCLGSVF